MKKSVLVIVSLLLVWYVFSVFNRVYWMDGSGPVEVTIATGTTLAEATGQLVALEVLDVDDAWLFEVYAKISGKDRSIKAGDFVVKKMDSASAILDTLAVASSEEKTLTFLEGWDLRDIAAYLVDQEVITEEGELFAITGHPAQPQKPSVGTIQIPELESFALYLQS